MAAVPNSQSSWDIPVTCEPVNCIILSTCTAVSTFHLRDCGVSVALAVAVNVVWVAVAIEAVVRRLDCVVQEEHLVRQIPEWLEIGMNLRLVIPNFTCCACRCHVCQLAGEVAMRERLLSRVDD